MVLVDPSTYDVATRRPPNAKMSARTSEAAKTQEHNNRCIQAAEEGLRQDSDVYRECVATGRNPRYSEAVDAIYQRLQLTPGFLKARWKEEIAIGGASADQVRAATRNFGSMPLIVLTQSEAAADPANAPFVRTHQHLSALSRIGQQRIVPESSHTIPLDQPEAVVAEIEEMLRKLSGPPASFLK
jgi:hypothetical protein